MRAGFRLVPWSALLFVAAALPLAAEDSVRMKNGAVFAGKIVDETEKVVLIKTASGTMTLSKSDIKSIKRESEQLRPKAPPPGAAVPAGPGGAPPPAASGATASDANVLEERARARGHDRVVLGPSLTQARDLAYQEAPSAPLVSLAVKPLMFKTLNPGAVPVSMLFSFLDRPGDRHVSVAVDGPDLQNVYLLPEGIRASTPIPIGAAWMEPGEALIRGLKAFVAAGGDPDLDTGVVLALEYRDLSTQTGGSSRPVLSWFIVINAAKILSRIYLDGVSGDTLHVELAPEHRRSVGAPTTAPPATPAAAPAASPAAGDALPALRPLFDRAQAIAGDWSSGCTPIGIEAHLNESPQGPAISFTYYFKKRGPAEKGFLYGVLGRTDRPDEMKGNHFTGQVAFIPSRNEIYPFQMEDLSAKEWIDVDEAARIARKTAAPAGSGARPPIIRSMFLGHRSRPGKDKDAVALCWVVELDNDVLVCLSALTGEVLHVQEPEPRDKSK